MVSFCAFMRLLCTRMQLNNLKPTRSAGNPRVLLALSSLLVYDMKGLETLPAAARHSPHDLVGTDLFHAT